MIMTYRFFIDSDISLYVIKTFIKCCILLLISFSWITISYKPVCFTLLVFHFTSRYNVFLPWYVSLLGANLDSSDLCGSLGDPMCAPTVGTLSEFLHKVFCIFWLIGRRGSVDFEVKPTVKLIYSYASSYVLISYYISLG